MKKTMKRLVARFSVALLIGAAVVPTVAPESAEAHYFGHYYITVSGSKVYAHTSANTYSGIDVGYVEMFLTNHAGSLSTTCAGTGAGCFTGQWSYTSTTKILTKHCMHATDGHNIGKTNPWVTEAWSYCLLGNGVSAEVTHFHDWRYV